MSPEKFRSLTEEQFAASVRTFKAIATETEIVLSGQYLVESLKKRSSRSTGQYRSPTEFTQTIRAFTRARRRSEVLKPHLTETLRRSGGPIDAAVMREFERARLKNITAGVETADSALAIGSVAELVRRADDTERAFDDAIAQAPHGDDETLPSDGSGDSQPPPSEGGGGGTSEQPPEPISFDQYPLDVQVKAQSAYDLEVAPGATAAVNSGSAGWTDLCVRMGIDPNIPPTEPLPQSVRDTLAQGANSIFNDLNNTITGIVAGVALSLGGPIGGGLAALAVFLIPRMLAEFEAQVVELLK